MKLTIDTDTNQTTIKKDGRLTTWRRLTHLERVKLINQITAVFIRLSERIAI